MSRVLPLLLLTGLSSCASPAPLFKPTEAVSTLGEMVELGSVRITPLGIVQDSRCPKDVQCIQQGTVELKTKIESTWAGDIEKVFRLSRIYLTQGECLQLAQVEPEASVGVPISPDEYRFHFHIDHSAETCAPEF